ncbi:MAG: nucleotidyl transferase AbiEii/AbiGii toxin family protein [Dehalococcoidia bacterium]
MKLRDSSSDLYVLCSAVSAKTGMPLAHVEKDYWVVELLRSVARPVDGGRVVFKGGTSLSKAFGLIHRFSEDVDILLVPQKGAGRGKSDGMLKGIAARAGIDMGLDPILETSTKGVKRYIRYEYAAAFTSDNVTQGVKLEMGVRGGPEPAAPHEIRSYVAEHAIDHGEPDNAYDEFAPVVIDVLDPARTLVEKAALLHDLASRWPETAEYIADKGRHFYDIYCLLGDAGVQKTLAEADFTSRVAADRLQVSRAFGLPATERPTEGFAVSPAFDPHHTSGGAFETAYRSALSLVWGERPDHSDVLRRVAEYSELL